MRRLLLFSVLALSVCTAGLAGPVSSTSQLPAKIEELENAGQLLAQNKVEEAYKLIQEAVKKYPALAPPQVILSRFVLQINPQQARPYLEKAVGENPDHPEAYITLAKVALGEGRISEGLLCGAKILELAGAPRWTSDQKAVYQKEGRAILAIGAESRRDWPTAKTQLAAWLELDPKNGQVRQRYAQALFNLDPPKIDEAYQEFQQAVKDDATLLPAAVLMARQYMAKHDAKKAGEFFDKAAKQEANNAKVHVAFADFLLQQGNAEAAKLHSDQAVKIDPKNIDVQRMQALVARFNRDYASATRILEDILRNSPADFFASNQLALILADMSDDASKKRAQELAEVNARQYKDANSIEPLSTVGYCYLRNGNVEQAKQILIKATQNQRVGPDTLYFLGAALAESNDTKDEAVKILKGAIDLQGFFFFRKEAKALHDKLAKDAPKAAASKDKATKGN